MVKWLSSLASVAVMLLVPFGSARSAPPPVFAADTCTSGVTLTLHPGLPISAGHQAMSIARDIPRTPFTVSVPVYPDAQPLAQFVASPFPQYPADPYLQTAGAEYQSSAFITTVKAWYLKTFTACGWRKNGSMTTNASALTSGISFVSTGNRNLTMEMTFGDSPSGGTYIAYGAEEITYPRRPAASYLHGPFSVVRLALDRAVMKSGEPVSHIVHRTLTNHRAIAQLVRSINAITEYYTVSGLCLGGLSLIGPAWLTFVRPNGTTVHAYESGPGYCGGLAVNGTRWLLDDGAVWNLIGRLDK